MSAAVESEASAAEPAAEQQPQEASHLQPGKRWDITEEERRLLHWHWANLEYGCSAPLGDVSLAHWNQVRMHDTARCLCMMLPFHKHYH